MRILFCSFSFSIFPLPVLLVSPDDDNNQEPLTVRPITEQHSLLESSPAASSTCTSTSGSRVSTPKMSNKTQMSGSEAGCLFAASTRRSKSSIPSAPAKSRQPVINSPYLQQQQQNRRGGRTVVVPHVIAPVAASLAHAATTAPLNDTTHLLVPTPKRSVFGNISNNSNYHHGIDSDEEDWHDSFDCFNDDDDDNRLADTSASFDNNDSSTRAKDETNSEEEDEDWSAIKNKSSRNMHQWIMYLLVIFSMSTLFLSPEQFEALVDMDVLVPHHQIKFWVSTTTRTIFSAVMGGDETMTAMMASGTNSSSSSSNSIIINGNHAPLGNSPIMTPIFLVDKGLVQSASQNNSTL
jgi:hypothetical protein